MRPPAVILLPLAFALAPCSGARPAPAPPPAPAPAPAAPQADPVASDLDVPEQPGSRLVEPPSVCIEQRLHSVRVLRLERDCTCGEPLSCTLTVQGDVIAVRFREDSGPGICDDCYPSWTACTLPNLSPERPISIRVNGRIVHEATTDASGRLPASPCRAVVGP